MRCERSTFLYSLLCFSKIKFDKIWFCLKTHQMYCHRNLSSSVCESRPEGCFAAFSKLLLSLKPCWFKSRGGGSPHKLRGTERWYLCGYISSKLAFSSSSECGRPHRCLFLALLARAHHFSRRALVANDGQGRWRLLFRLRQLKGHKARTEAVVIINQYNVFWGNEN